MDANITNRLTPIVGRYEHLQSDIAIDLDKACKSLEGFGLFTIPTLEYALSQAKAECDRILQDDIPCLLAEYGLKKAELLDGSTIEPKTFYNTSQEGCDKSVLASWLEANGYGDIIKDTIALGKGEFDEELKNFLEENGYGYSKDSNVNGQSLKKVITDHIKALEKLPYDERAARMPPEEAVKVKTFTQAVITKPKAPKGF